MYLAEKWLEMVVKWPTHNVVTVFLKQTLSHLKYVWLNSVKLIYGVASKKTTHAVQCSGPYSILQTQKRL